MAVPKASRAPFLLALLLAAALVSSCYASREALGEKKKVAAVVVPMADPKCEVMERCSVQLCTEYCITIGLGNEVGFCTFHDMQFYCCCPIPDPGRQQ